MRPRNLRIPASLLTALALLSSYSALLGASEARRTPMVRAVERVRQSIVNIHSQRTIPDSRLESARRVSGMGTGCIIDTRGYIVTNQHVIDGVDELRVTLADGRAFTAHVISSSHAHDLAVIRIDAGEPLPVVPLGTARDLMLGETVIAIGNAYGYEHTVTAGIVSALHRDVEVNDELTYYNLIQTDASINPGNSGGPLINLDGEVVGLNVAIRAGAQRIGFAIPIDDVLDDLAEVLDVRDVNGTWHGMVAVRTTNGVRIEQVEPDSPAARAGVRPGDMLVRVAERPITYPLDLQCALLEMPPDRPFDLVIRRTGSEQHVSMALAVEPLLGDRGGADLAWDLLGLSLSPVAADALYPNREGYRGGLQVTRVRPDSPAASEGIRRGDVLVGLHVWETVTLDNVAFVLSRPDRTQIEPLKFYVVRSGQTLFGFLHLSPSGRYDAAGSSPVGGSASAAR